MNDPASHPVINDISARLDSLTPKAQTLGTYIMQHPSKAVFMTTKELAEECSVSTNAIIKSIKKTCKLYNIDYELLTLAKKFDITAILSFSIFNIHTKYNCLSLKDL